jgi:hypothetical protein
VYYSDSLPKGRGDNVEYDNELYNLAYGYHGSVGSAGRPFRGNPVTDNPMGAAPPEFVRLLQDKLLDIGYLDKTNPDSFDPKGNWMLEAAAIRYIKNKQNENMGYRMKRGWGKLKGILD